MYRKALKPLTNICFMWLASSILPLRCVPDYRYPLPKKRIYWTPPPSALEHFLWDFCEAVSWAIVLSKMRNKLNSHIFVQFFVLLHSFFTISFLVKELKNVPVVFLFAWKRISPWVTVVYLYYKNFILSSHLQFWASSLFPETFLFPCFRLFSLCWYKAFLLSMRKLWAQVIEGVWLSSLLK